MSLDIVNLEGEALYAAIEHVERLEGRTTSLLSRPTDREQQIDLIIDRERISTIYETQLGHWVGGFELQIIDDTEVGCCWALEGQQFGPTRRIAAMRAYVHRSVKQDLKGY